METLTYSYSGDSTNNAGLHAPSSVTSNSTSMSYDYDENGNILTRGAHGSTWTAANRIGLTSGKHGSSGFLYSSAGSRVRHSVKNAAGADTRRTFYAAGVEQAEKADAAEPDGWRTTRTRMSVPGPGGGAIASVSYGDSGGLERKYFLRDHLGSIVAWVDGNASGAMVVDDDDESGNAQWFAYDAWGSAVDPEDWGYLAPDTSADPETSVTERGFTGHEMLPETELVHMNGRLFDPLLATFVSPDPFVQAPNNPQNYNRYSYVLNNPLSLFDPSGYNFEVASGVWGNGGDWMAWWESGGYGDFSLVGPSRINALLVFSVEYIGSSNAQEGVSGTVGVHVKPDGSADVYTSENLRGVLSDKDVLDEFVAKALESRMGASADDIDISATLVGGTVSSEDQKSVEAASGAQQGAQGTALPPFRVSSDRYPDRNTVITDGNGGLEVNIEHNLDPRMPKIIIDGIHAHENKHIEQISQLSPDIALGHEKGYAIDARADLLPKMEVEAHNVEIDFLRTNMNNSKYSDPYRNHQEIYESVVDSRIQTLESERERYKSQINTN